MKTSEGKDASWLSVTGRDGERREGITRVGVRGGWEGADILWLRFDASCHAECLFAHTPWGSGGGGGVGEHASTRQRMPLVMPPMRQNTV